MFSGTLTATPIHPMAMFLLIYYVIVQTEALGVFKAKASKERGLEFVSTYKFIVKASRESKN